jgi:hypothetical protein
MAELNLLQTPINKLFLGHQFEWQCRVMGFATLEAILLLSPEELVARPGFTYHWLGELSALLSKHQLLHLLQSTPGKSFG